MGYAMKFRENSASLWTNGRRIDNEPKNKTRIKKKLKAVSNQKHILQSVSMKHNYTLRWSVWQWEKICIFLVDIEKHVYIANCFFFCTMLPVARLLYKITNKPGRNEISFNTLSPHEYSWIVSSFKCYKLQKICIRLHRHVIFVDYNRFTYSYAVR